MKTAGERPRNRRRFRAGNRINFPSQENPPEPPERRPETARHPRRANSDQIVHRHQRPAVRLDLLRTSRTRFGSNLKRGRARTSAYSARCVIVANLNCAGQCERENLGGISLRLEQTRHDDVGVEHDFHFRRRARRRAAISASMSDMESSAAPLAAAACCSADCA